MYFSKGLAKQIEAQNRMECCVLLARKKWCNSKFTDLERWPGYITEWKTNEDTNTWNMATCIWSYVYANPVNTANQGDSRVATETSPSPGSLPCLRIGYVLPSDLPQHQCTPQPQHMHLTMRRHLSPAPEYPHYLFFFFRSSDSETSTEWAPNDSAYLGSQPHVLQRGILCWALWDEDS